MSKATVSLRPEWGVPRSTLWLRNPQDNILRYPGLGDQFPTLVGYAAFLVFSNHILPTLWCIQRGKVLISIALFKLELRHILWQHVRELSWSLELKHCYRHSLNHLGISCTLLKEVGNRVKPAMRNWEALNQANNGENRSLLSHRC